jgi:Reverse transcriptase (RNA-dependent DNA polymerase)
MESIGFDRLQYDNYVYFKKLVDGSYMYLLLYVDDIFIACLNKEEIKRVKEQLSLEFKMKELGPAKKILGMEITRDRSNEKLYLSQKGFVEKVLDRFKMKEAKSVSTPLAGKFRLSRHLSPKTEKEKSYMAEVMNSSAIGSIMYLMICTRLDIAHAVSVVSHYLSCPDRVHWEKVKWILRYLKDTTNAHLEFGRSDSKLIGYVDSDFMGALDKKRSLTVYVFILGGCVIS